MLGREQTAQLPGVMLQEQVAAMAKPMIGGGLVAEQTQPLSSEGLRRFCDALLNPDPDLF